MKATKRSLSHHGSARSRIGTIPWLFCSNTRRCRVYTDSVYRVASPRLRVRARWSRPCLISDQALCRLFALAPALSVSIPSVDGFETRFTASQPRIEIRSLAGLRGSSKHGTDWPDSVILTEKFDTGDFRRTGIGMKQTCFFFAESSEIQHLRCPQWRIHGEGCSLAVIWRVDEERERCDLQADLRKVTIEFFVKFAAFLSNTNIVDCALFLLNFVLDQVVFEYA